MATSEVPVYSGYRSIWPFWSALSAIGAEPRLSFATPLNPLASRAWAYMLPSMNCSVKSFEPTVIVGPPPPPEAELSVPPTLPQATSTSNERPTRSAGTARISLVLFFISPPLSFVRSSTSLLRDLESFRGEGPLQRAEADFGDDREYRDGDGPGQQYLRPTARVTLHYQVTQAPATDERREGGARDGLHGGGPDAGEDHGCGYGQLYTGQDLAPREPHPAGGVDDVLTDLPEPCRGVDQDRGNSQRRERDQGRAEPDAEQRQCQRQDRKARHGAPDVTDVDGYRRAEGRVAYQ